MTSEWPKLFLLILLSLSLCHARSANAVPIPARDWITFAGIGQSSVSSGVTNVAFNTFGVLAKTGAFSTLPTGMVATFNDFSYVGTGDLASLVAPVTLWTIPSVPSFSFTLNSLSLAAADKKGLLLAGTGILHAPGYDPTEALVGIGGIGNKFAYLEISKSLSTGVSSAEPSPVPEGGSTAILLGLSALSIVAFGKLRAKVRA